jgi:sugar lactone lactonase YvrE
MKSYDTAAGILRGRKLRVTIALLVLVTFATFAVAATASRQQTAAGGYKVVGKWGGVSTKPGKFGTSAMGLAVDKAGTVYVADTNANRIQSFSSTGAFKKVFTFASAGSVPDVAVGPDGGVWGTTQVNVQVHRFPPVAGTPFTTPGSAEGIAIDADGNVYVASSSGTTEGVLRFAKTPTGWEPAKMWATSGLQAPVDVEVSPDGTVYVADTRGAPPNVKRFDANGRLLKKINMKMQATAGAAVTLGIGVDLDCNVWAVNAPERNVMQYSPTGKLLGAVTSGDMLATDIAFGPTGDLYVFDIYGPHSVVRFAEDRSKPATAAVPGQIVVSKGVAKVKYTLAGVACPDQVTATASLSGKGISGRATAKVAAGKTTVISIPVKAAKGSTSAQFKIVLKTNGRPTTQTRSVKVSVK